MNDQSLMAAAMILLPLFWLLLYAATGTSNGSWGTDFHAFYGAAQQFAAGNGHIYDRDILSNYLATNDPAFSATPFPYPPSMGLLLWPLAGVSYLAAYIVWTAIGIILFTFALAMAWSALYPQKNIGMRYGVSLCLSIASPFSFADIVVGQTGHILSALLLLAVFQPRQHPWYSAVALGALCIKPQIALLAIPVLCWGGHWQVLRRGACIALGLSLLSAAIWGVGCWVEHVKYLDAFSHAISAKPAHQALTVSSLQTLRLLGVPAGWAWCGYLALAALAMVGIGMTKKQGRYEVMMLLPLWLAGAIFLLPYGFWYDVVFLNAPLLWLFGQSAKTGWYKGEMTGLCLVSLGSAASIMQMNQQVNISIVWLMVLYVLVWRRFNGAGGMLNRH